MSDANGKVIGKLMEEKAELERHNARLISLNKSADRQIKRVMTLSIELLTELKAIADAEMRNFSDEHEFRIWAQSRAGEMVLKYKTAGEK